MIKPTCTVEPLLVFSKGQKNKTIIRGSNAPECFWLGLPYTVTGQMFSNKSILKLIVYKNQKKPPKSLLFHSVCIQGCLCYMAAVLFSLYERKKENNIFQFFSHLPETHAVIGICILQQKEIVLLLILFKVKL